MHTQICQHFRTLAAGGVRTGGCARAKDDPPVAPLLGFWSTLNLELPHLSFTPPTYVLSACGIDGSDLRCSICLEVYQCPVELQCGTLVCAACCSQWVQVTAGVSCPCCFAHQLDDTNIQPPTSVVSDLLGSLWVECTAEGCIKVVKARRNLRKHLESGCKHYSETSTDSPSRVSLRDILSQPTTTPTTPAEKRVLRSLQTRGGLQPS